MNWIKENWFKFAIIIVLLTVCIIAYRAVSISANKDLSQEQDKCREAGEKNDEQQSYFTTDKIIGYYYNPDLHTCLGAYRYIISKNVTPPSESMAVKDDLERNGYGIIDLYNNVKILTCDNVYYPSHNIFDEETITENLKGIYHSDDIVIKTKTDTVWKLCGKYTSELTGGKYDAGYSF